MNSKGKMQSQLSAYLDGELDEAQLRRVENALEADAALRQELADLAAARNLLRGLPIESPPVDLVSRVLAEAERSQLVGAPPAEAVRRPSRWMRLAASAAMLLVAASVGMIVAATLFAPPVENGYVAHSVEPNDISAPEKPAIAARDTKSFQEKSIGKSDRFGEQTLGGKRRRDRGVDESHKADMPAKPAKRRAIPGFTKRAKFENGEVLNRDADSRTKHSLAKEPAITAGTTFAKGGLGESGKAGRGRKDLNNFGTLNIAGTDGNIDRQSGLASNIDVMSKELLGDLTDNEVIYTDRLGRTQRQIETVLATNGVAAMIVQGDSSSGSPALAGGQAKSQAQAQTRANFFVTNKLSAAQVQYEVYVTPEQMAKVQKELNQLRAKLSVSQDVPALALANGPRSDGNWRFARRGSAARNEGNAYKYKKDAERKANLLLEKAEGKQEAEKPVMEEDKADLNAALAMAPKAKTPAPAPPAKEAPVANVTPPPAIAPAAAEAKPAAPAPAPAPTAVARPLPGAAPEAPAPTPEVNAARTDGPKTTKARPAAKAPAADTTGEKVEQAGSRSTEREEALRDIGEARARKSKRVPLPVGEIQAVDKAFKPAATTTKDSKASSCETPGEAPGPRGVRVRIVGASTQTTAERATITVADNERRQQPDSTGQSCGRTREALHRQQAQPATQSARANLRRLVITLNLRRPGDAAATINQAATELTPQTPRSRPSEPAASRAKTQPK